MQFTFEDSTVHSIRRNGLFVHIILLARPRKKSKTKRETNNNFYFYCYYANNSFKSPIQKRLRMNFSCLEHSSWGLRPFFLLLFRENRRWKLDRRLESDFIMGNIFFPPPSSIHHERNKTIKIVISLINSLRSEDKEGKCRDFLRRFAVFDFDVLAAWRLQFNCGIINNSNNRNELRWLQIQFLIYLFRYFY